MVKFLTLLLGAVILVGGTYYWTINNGMPSTYTNEETPTPTPNTNSNNTNTGVKEPGAPTVSTKGETAVSSTQSVLNGEVNPNGAQTSYWYEYGLTNSLGSATSPQLIGGGYLTYGAPQRVTGLQANTTYHYRLAAQNEHGKVYGEILSLQTTNTPPVASALVTAETRGATDVEQKSATLSGRVNPNGSYAYYWFEYGKNLTLGSTTAAGSAGAGTVNLDVTTNISGLEPSTTYYYRFNAQNVYGTDNGNILSFRTDPVTPEPPKGNAPEATTTSATGITQTGALLHGEVNPNGVQTSYYFEYGKSTLFGIFALDEKTDSKSAGKGTTGVSVSAPLIKLDADSTYYYRLVATNENGTTFGAIFRFTTKKQ